MAIRRLARAASHARRRPEQWLSVPYGLAQERMTTIAENSEVGRARMRSSWPEERILVLMKPARATRRFLPGSPFNAVPVEPPVEQFAVRDRVTHDKYGLGWVVQVEDDDAVIVDFGSRRVRVLTPFARLTKL